MQHYEARLFNVVDSLSVRGWFLIWIGTVVASAFAYWLITHFVDLHGLAFSNDGHNPNLVDSFYFSFVTITTVGYGDIAPYGVARIVAMVEAVIGVFVVGALISKALSTSQEKLILETNELAFGERVARILTNIQFLLTEFQSIRASDDQSSESIAQDQRRMHNAVWTLEHVLRAVGELLQYQRYVDPLTLRAVLSTMHNTLEEFRDARQRVSNHERLSSADETGLARAVSRICDHRIPEDYPDDVRTTARIVHELAVSIFRIEEDGH